MTPTRSTDGYYIVKQTTAKRDICWFCDALLMAGAKMVKYLYVPTAPARPVCPNCAREIE